MLATTRSRIGAAAQGLATAFGTKDKKSNKGFFGFFGRRETHVLPAHLLGAVEALYHLQRGSMFGDVVGHADERLHLLHLCLQADLPLASTLIMPRAWQVRLPKHCSYNDDVHPRWLQRTPE
jgi:hypothetical protein